MLSAFKFSNRCIEREQAPFHSALLIWVWGSQNEIQASKLLPPPPAILGAASVGLELEGVAESVRALPPAVRVVVEVVTGCDSGAISWSC